MAWSESARMSAAASRKAKGGGKTSIILERRGGRQEVAIKREGRAGGKWRAHTNVTKSSARRLAKVMKSSGWRKSRQSKDVGRGGVFTSSMRTGNKAYRAAKIKARREKTSARGKMYERLNKGP